jgi:hypothetical protein
VKRSPLARKTPLQRSAPIKRKHGSTAVPADVYLAVTRRDGGCVARRTIPHVSCFGRIDPHHIRRRSQGGPDTPENLVSLCRAHHSWVHEHITESLALGLLLKASA